MRSSPVGNAIMDLGKPQTIPEQQMASDYPISSALGGAAPSLMIPSIGVSKAAPLATKIATNMAEGALGAQAETYATPEDRARATLYAAGTGGLVKAGTETIKTLASGLRPYLPFAQRTAATKELSQARQKTSLGEAAVMDRAKRIYGEDVNLLSLADLTNDPRIRNKEVAYALAQTPEGAQQVLNFSRRKEQAFRDVAKEFQGYTSLRKGEADFMAGVYADMKGTKLLPEDFTKITSNPRFKEELKVLRKDPAFKRLMDNPDNGGPLSAYMMAEVRKNINPNRGLKEGEKLSSASEREVNALYKDLDEALVKATNGDYDKLKGLEQMKIFSDNLDREVANVPMRMQEGVQVPDINAYKKVFQGKSFRDMYKFASVMRNKEDRKNMRESLRLVQNFATDLDSKTAANVLGKFEEASPGGSGPVTRGINKVGTLLRGGYNKEMSYLINHPSEYIDELRRIEQLPPGQKIAQFTRVLGNIRGQQEGE